MIAVPLCSHPIEGQVLLLVPSVVNVSEGQVAVVCFQADFNTILRGDGENFQLNLTLAVVNVETSELCTSPSPMTHK